MTEIEKMAKGYLWNDTEEYLEEQRIAKDLMYEFNQSRPSEIAKREEIVKQLFLPMWLRWMHPVKYCGNLMKQILLS